MNILFGIINLKLQDGAETVKGECQHLNEGEDEEINEASRRVLRVIKRSNK